MNYNILALLAAVLLVVLALVLTGVGQAMLSLVVFMVGLVVLPLKIILEIVAAIKAGRGKAFHFPLDIRIIK